MINIQNLIAWASRPGVRACLIEFDQYVFAQFKALKLALLIFDAFDFGILHELHVKSHQLIGDAFQWIYTEQSTRYRVDVLNAAFERRRQGAFRPRSVVEARLAIACFSLTTPATKRTTGIERSFDRMSAMMDFGGGDDFAGLLIDDGDACCLRSGINFDFQIGRRRIFDLSLENNREGIMPEHGSLARLQKQSGAARCRRRKRFFGCV
jgi:hypothetical protein